MFNAGAARMLVEFQDSIESVDSLHAPTRTWSKYAECYAAIENEQFLVDDSFTNGPREESIKTMTLIIRNHTSFAFNTRQRVKDLRSGELFEITGIRYDGKRTMCFVDVRGGQADG